MIVNVLQGVFLAYCNAIVVHYLMYSICCKMYWCYIMLFAWGKIGPRHSREIYSYVVS